MDLSSIGKPGAIPAPDCPKHSLVPVVMRQVTDEQENVFLVTVKAVCPHCTSEINFQQSGSAPEPPK